MREITRKTFLVSATGGTLDYASADGEILFSVAVPPGKISAREYLDLIPPGGHIQIADGLVAVNPRSAYGLQAYGPGSHETGANPDFVPTSASRMEKEMRLMLNRMTAATNRVEARERQLATIERVPRAPDPVLDDEAPPKKKKADKPAEPAPEAETGGDE